jgi:hypothetical protein
MSKRKRKSSRRRSSARRSTTTGPRQRPAQSSLNAPASVADSAAGATDSEYKYVTSDLKRVTILAVAMFALLIALSFFIG